MAQRVARSRTQTVAVLLLQAAAPNPRDATTMNSLESLFIWRSPVVREPECVRRAHARARASDANVSGGCCCRLTFFSTQPSMMSAISRFFLSSIIMWVTPRIPMSSSLRYSAFAVPCFAARRALIASTVSWHTVLVAV